MRFILIFFSYSSFAQITTSATSIYNHHRVHDVQDGLVYGNLEQLYPEKTFNEIKIIRQSNYTTLKTILESRPFVIANKTLEVYPSSTSIKGNLTINGSNSTIVVYPFVPQYNLSETKFIEPRYGDTHNISGVTIKTAQKNNQFETYSCILKPSGQANKVQLLGTVRRWADWQVGDKIWYAWTRAVLGEVKTIQSIDSVAGTITLTTNISGSVSSDTQGDNVKVGTSFPEDISQTDYLAYGQSWIIAANYVNLIYAVPASNSGVDYVGNFTDVTFDNCNNQIMLSMGSGKLNLTRVRFSDGVVALSYFNRGLAGGQKVTITDWVVVERSGGIVAGAIASLETTGNYGAGGYLHDSIIVKCNGTLYLTDNKSASWRQYSSGRGPETGDYSYYKKIIASGSGEYDFLSSNTMSTVIDTLISPYLALFRSNTTVNYGIINNTTAYGLRYDHGEIDITFNNCSFTKLVNLLDSTDFVFNNCTFSMDSTVYPSVMIQNQGLVTDNIVSFINCTITANRFNDYTPGSSLTGTRGGSWLAFSKLKNVVIDNLTVPAKEFTLLSSGQGQSPYTEHDISINISNTDVNCYQFCLDNSTSSAGTVSNTITGRNVNVISEISDNRGKGFIQSITGKSGEATKSISTSTFNNIGSLTNCLEIDFAHDHYTTSGTLNNIVARVWTGNLKTSANPQYADTITVTANGNLTIGTSGNIMEGTNLTSGQSVQLVLDRKHIYKSDSTFKDVNLFIGTGVTTYKGLMTDRLFNSFRIFVDDVEYFGTDGFFDNVLFYAYIDQFTGRYEFRFASPTTAEVRIEYYNPTWINTGAWYIL